MERYDVLVIGGGLSGLTAASLLSKRGCKVAVIEKSYMPGGSCGIFKRGDRTFDQGSAMLYGFGEKGFNAHRFVMNCLEEPIEILHHDLLYCVNYEGKRIRFYEDLDRFIEELSSLFPKEKESIRRFYVDMRLMYEHIMVENPTYTSADETDPKSALKSMRKHPISYMRFLGYLNKSARSLLEKYFKDPEIFNFFDKLTSTYCYATVEEAPAVLASVMFVDNHVGGSYYPAGSTLFLPGKLEKVIEEHGGDMYLETEASEILFQEGEPCGVRLQDGRTLYGNDIIYSGTVWNLYGKMIPESESTEKKRTWAKNQVPTYPSVVLYAAVDREVIPEDTAPIEMLVGSPDKLDESEVTAYLLSIDDRTLCPEDEHLVMAIGPTFLPWETFSEKEYQEKKKEEKERLLQVLEKRFPGLLDKVRFTEVATPRTIERYNMKNGGAVAGPKQMLGQHMFNRLHIRTEWKHLYACGESTVMGTGTPTVTTSGLSAANAVLKSLGKEPFVYQEGMKNHVHTVEKPFTRDRMYEGYEVKTKGILLEAMRCRFCEYPSCSKGKALDVRGIMRRVSVGNLHGAKKCLERTKDGTLDLSLYEDRCILKHQKGEPVHIREIISYLEGGQYE
ncbi:prolycopene isomerase [Proteiniclasticum ruminis]|uniref:Prolycopene isomerase n=2 Tax=Proteiniclasticum ruminis TaxID=398199 RepID=A0A1I5DZI2_9CLOT|nr:prolycopene isomerase [Proteiniclasticum ruminis]